MSDLPAASPINVDNEYALVCGENLPNHSVSMSGRAKFVQPGSNEPPRFRTRQQIYRFVSHLLILAEQLPDEDGAHDLPSVQEAIEASLS